MPVIVKKRGDSWSVVERSSGKAVSGGTHKSRGKAMRQATAINIAHARKKGYDVPARRK